MKSRLCTLALLSLAVAAGTRAATFGRWSAAFPEIACRVPHLDERFGSGDREVRLQAVRAVTAGQARNAALYTPFFRTLLRDPDPEIAWIALSVLADHGVMVPPRDVPPVLEVPLVGRFESASADARESLRRRILAPKRAGRPLPGEAFEAAKGWALRALSLAGAGDIAPLAEKLSKSPDPFVRFNAGTAFLRAGRDADGLRVLRALVAGDDMDYAVLAAEALARNGDEAALRDLQKALTRPAAEHAPLKPVIRDILADLTGVYLVSAEEWDDWLERRAAQSH